MTLKYKVNKICIISDNFIPTPISSSGMIYNLANNFASKKIEVICIHSGFDPNSRRKKISNRFLNYNISNLTFLTTSFLLSFRNKSYYHRFIFEISVSIILALKCLLNYKKIKDIDLIVWYGPSPFLWIVVFTIKIFKKVPVYYILRDIFPDWVINLKIINNKFIIFLLKTLSFPQYTVSDRIGVETEFNKQYLIKRLKNNKKIEVLYNWPSISDKDKKIIINNNSSINNFLKELNLKNIIGLYTGNTSLAHDYFKNLEYFSLLNMNIKIKYNIDIHFFGKENLKSSNTIFNKSEHNITHFKWDYLPDYELIELYKNVNFGIVSLNINNKTENIPGKFVSYIQAGLPVICFTKYSSSLAKMIINNDCGIVIDADLPLKNNIKLLENFLKKIIGNKGYYNSNSRKVFKKYFDTDKISKQILFFKEFQSSNNSKGI